MVRESAVHFSLYPNCHHQVVFAKISLKIYLPSPYEKLEWQFQKVNSSLIKLTVDYFDWPKAFQNVDVDRKV